MRPPQPRGRTPEPPRDATSPLDKAAIVMMVLDEERSHRIFSRLEEEEIRRLSRAMANLGRADVEVVERTISEFRNEVGRTGNVFGTVESTERLLRRMLPGEKVEEIMDEIKGPEGKNMWEKLSNISPEVLSSYLRNEYPQTAAVILAKLPAPHAARVLRLLPEPVAAEISVRLVRMDSIQRSVLVDIEETLKREFMTNLARSYERDSSSIMAEMLNRSDKDMVERVMRVLEEKEPQAAARIRRIMFTFEDLARVDRSTFGVLIAECPADRLPIALSGALPETRDLFLSNMSERAANMLREEIDAMPAQRRKTIDDAQAEIIAIAKRLAEEGRIFILDENEETEEMG
ncbi:Flagellar motor switch protein FliG (plasmid) [Rhodovastum atsumiense]|uniref:flagellar motor switch protein FliG n=1 Tax=Rhodovastum atsumiense TaxID=504468 RepID=UPI00202595A8|nr:flagellar motor switch protein FliG [Rhodovastum atsumiense]CAH2605527.1 Flagellar motor switch protein FliG [Rhodovastum atsumiense]